MENNTADTVVYILFALVILFFAASFFLVYVLKPFIEDRQYIKSEIKRAHSKNSRQYWKGELKKLYISYIPIIGKKLVNNTDN